MYCSNVIRFSLCAVSAAQPVTPTHDFYWVQYMLFCVGIVYFVGREGGPVFAAICLVCVDCKRGLKALNDCLQSCNDRCVQYLLVFTRQHNNLRKPFITYPFYFGYSRTAGLCAYVEMP